MARVAAVFDDLLLGSNVLGILQAAGHEAVLIADPPDRDPGRDPDRDPEGAFDALVVDLTAAGIDPAALAGRLPTPRPKLLGLFSHVHPEQRERALAAGFDLVVPRSRFAREGAALVERLLSPGSTDRRA